VASPGLNRVMLLGRLGMNPEMKEVSGNMIIARFSMAIESNWKDSDGHKRKKVEWVNLVAWGKTAKIVGKFLNKGDLVMIEGRLSTEKWERDGRKFRSTHVVAERMTFLPNEKAKAQPEGEEESGVESADEHEIDEATF
jgi:single-strand DNA-binding protein